MPYRRVFPEAIEKCAICTEGEMDFSHMSFDCPFARQYGPVKSGCHNSRGILRISNGRHIQVGGERGKTRSLWAL